MGTPITLTDPDHQLTQALQELATLRQANQDLLAALIAIDNAEAHEVTHRDGPKQLAVLLSAPQWHTVAMAIAKAKSTTPAKPGSTTPTGQEQTP